MPRLAAAGDRAGLPGSALAGIAITRQTAEGTTLRILPDAPPAAIDRLCERLPANQRQSVRDAYREALTLRCPAERGLSLTLPLLAWRQGDLILGEATGEELRQHGRFSARDCPSHDCDWSNDRQATTSEIDADAAGHLGISEARIRPLPQRALSEPGAIRQSQAADGSGLATGDEGARAVLVDR